MVGRLFNKKSRRRRRTGRFRFGTKSAGNYKERVISVGNKPLHDIEDNHEQQFEFVDNEIKTAKYTAITFLPRNLFEQFRRMANFYFLIVGVTQLVIESPVSPFASIAPLVFVVSVTMLKQGYEDVMRHKADAYINKKLVTRVECNGVNEIPSQKIEVGDVLCIEDGDEFPCDLLLLSGSNSNGKATIMTANLDGETNLKTHLAPILTRSLCRPHQLNNLKAQVECENPNADLNRFIGRLTVQEEDQMCALGLENVVFRGTQLKNTDFVYGCAIYTGHDTKMSQNSRLKSNKFSSIEVTMNKYLGLFVGILLAQIILASTLKYTLGVDKPGTQKDGSLPWYFGTDIELSGQRVAQDVLSFMVLFNYIIPISMYVTLELQKFFGSLFLIWDLQLYEESTNQPAKCNSSDLNEELGQVEYLFSDKTGTLTENVMVFKACSIGGVLFRDQCENLVCESPQGDYKERSVRRFLEVLSLCHTVHATKAVDKLSSENPHDLIYTASSPDEKAIVEACRNYGVAFLGEKEKGTQIHYRLLLSQSSRTQKASFERLHVLEFDSVRKRMSVVLRDSRGVIRLLTKGAEISVLPLCACTTSERIVDVTMAHIDQFATDGLRTLAVAVRTFSPEEFVVFERAFAKASQAIDKREEKIRAVYESVETNLELIGAIGVEDKLQEGVRDTLVSLGEAGVKVWILTGDKKETAVNISWACGHLRPNMKTIDIAGLENTIVTQRVLEERLEEQAAQMTTDFTKPDECLIVDGKTLTSVFQPANKADTVPLLRNLAESCASVICCRMSPLQKAEIVAMIKYSNKKKSPVTAAIGDGANDVAMIQEAHVGLGVMGKEGRAAVRAADFAFAKFRHLKRVLLVHGHWYYVRAATLVQYFFYKNVAAFTAQLLFAFYSNYSTQSIYDSVNLTLYNITFTSLPIFVYGLFEQNLDQDILMRNPGEYKKIAKNRLLRSDKCFLWLLEALWQSLVTFFAFYLYWKGASNQTSQPDSLEMYAYGLAIYQSVVIVVNLRLLLQARSWNWFLVMSVAFSLMFFLCFTLAFHATRVIRGFANLFLEDPVDKNGGNVPMDFGLYRVIFHLISSPGIWMTTLLVIVVSLLPYVVVQAVPQLTMVVKDISSGISKKFNPIIGKRVYRVSPKPQQVVYYVNAAYQE